MPQGQAPAQHLPLNIEVVPASPGHPAMVVVSDPAASYNRYPMMQTEGRDFQRALNKALNDCERLNRPGVGRIGDF